MTQIHRAFVALLILLTALWLLANGTLPQPLTYFSFRAWFIQYSGVLAIGVMSVAMILATRPAWLEARLNGLDKMYRLHKWLGVTGLVMAVGHWWLARGTKWMVGWGWLERPERAPRGEQTLGLVEGWFRSQRGLAETLGEWAFYALAVLLILALSKRFPYHLFAKTHKLLAALYLVLVFHSLVLLTFDDWQQPMGWLLALLLAGGSVSALASLTGRIGRDRQVSGRVQDLAYSPALRVLATEVALDGPWPGHRAGQFAFVRYGRDGEPHPYTIASAWQPGDPALTFVTKALGDHTGRLPGRLRPGQTVRVEGPYGCFDFRDGKRRQIWVGAGIGITPFLAGLKARASQPDEVAVDLFHVTRDVDPVALDRLAADAAAAGVRLHVWQSGRDGRLDGAAIRAAVPDWRSASLWFCGPAPFGRSLRADFLRHGLASGDIHQELFQMR
ncbi:ferric reductase [Marinobacter lutaoensis]|uniref:Ferric reductase n=1 Tax=Marinobacter lutaoensis TaxID=135739 RepID=A0A1V2DS38_9GAMM|nr:ferric reductase-like transmembrane domain-containing protein [Marinobacter lutaoensis]ONF43339.1 ferric reductase [Marinobacter lutaoensis]